MVSHIYVLQKLKPEFVKREDYDNAWSWFVFDATADVHYAIKKTLSLVGDNPQVVERHWSGITIRGKYGVIEIRAFAQDSSLDVDELQPIIDEMFPIPEGDNA